MITHLTLENWKAYASLDLPLDQGATFVIAKNGVGKTSLVQGAMWALFGDSFGADAAACVRSGADETNATVEVSLGGQDVRISRSFSLETGKTDVAITIGGRTAAGPEAVERYLRQELGAEPSVLARMCFLREGEAVAGGDNSAFDLYSHLTQVFGVDTLLRLSDEEDTRRRRLARQARDTRRSQRLADSSRAEFTERLRQLGADLAALRLEQDAARAALNTAQQAFTTVSAWKDYDVARQRREAERKDMVARIAASLGTSEISEEALLSRLISERTECLARLEELSREHGSVDAERSLLAGFSSSLRDDDATCPVCLRPISPNEREHAQRAHSDRMAELEQRGAEVSGESRMLRQRLGELEQWTNELSARGGGPVSPSIPRPDSWSEEAMASARELLKVATNSLEQITARVAQAEEIRRGLADQIEQDAEAIARSAMLFRQYREEALSQLVSETLRRTADELCSRQIDPLAAEIRNRWKLLWPNRAPLQLLADGRLVATRAEREVPYAEFSGGEKVVSTIILRLLALSMTTSTPFLWLDEPLEHLDPRNRRMVASLLVRASQGDQTRQIVATTYEEAVARRLDENNAARLVYVEAEPET